MAREEEGHQNRRREAVTSSEQQDSKGGVAADADVTMTIRQLPSYLQQMVTLLANMVPPHEESKMREKTLEQGTSIMIAISTTYPLDKIFLSVACSVCTFYLFNTRCYGSGLGSPGLLEAPRPDRAAN